VLCRTPTRQPLPGFLNLTTLLTCDRKPTLQAWSSGFRPAQKKTAPVHIFAARLSRQRPNPFRGPAPRRRATMRRVGRGSCPHRPADDWKDRPAIGRIPCRAAAIVLGCPRQPADRHGAWGGGPIPTAQFAKYAARSWFRSAWPAADGRGAWLLTGDQTKNRKKDRPNISRSLFTLTPDPVGAGSRKSLAQLPGGNCHRLLLIEYA